MARECRLGDECPERRVASCVGDCDACEIDRGPADPLNTTGVGMPSKGGNPALTDEDLYDIVAYIRTLQK